MNATNFSDMKPINRIWHVLFFSCALGIFFSAMIALADRNNSEDSRHPAAISQEIDRQQTNKNTFHSRGTIGETL